MTVATTSYSIEGPEILNGNQTGELSGPVQVQTLEEGTFDLLHYLPQIRD